MFPTARCFSFPCSLLSGLGGLQAQLGQGHRRTGRQHEGGLEVFWTVEREKAEGSPEVMSSSEWKRETWPPVLGGPERQLCQLEPHVPSQDEPVQPLQCLPARQGL